MEMLTSSQWVSLGKLAHPLALDLQGGGGLWQPAADRLQQGPGFELAAACGRDGGGRRKDFF